MRGLLGAEAVVGLLALTVFLAMAFWSSYGRRQGHPPRWPGGVSMSVAGEVSVLMFTATMAMAACFPAWQAALVPLLLIAVVLGLYAQFRDARNHKQRLADLRELNAAKYPEAFDETRLRFAPGEILTGTTVRLFDNRTGRLLGEVPGELLRPLVRYLEKSRSPDYWGVLRDEAYLVEEELEILRVEGVAPELRTVLQQGMASSHDLELRWVLKPTSF